MTAPVDFSNPATLSRMSNLIVLKVPLFSAKGVSIRPLRVQKFETCIAMAMHNSFEEQDSIHRDAKSLGLSLDTSRVWKVLCRFIASV